MARTLASMRAEVRQRADMENDDDLVTDSEIDAFIKASTRTLTRALVARGLLSQAGPGVTSQTTALVAGQDTYFGLETYAVVGVDVDYGNGFVPLRRLPWAERGRGTDQWRRHGTSLRYVLVDNGLGVLNVMLDPAPEQAGTLRVWYTSIVVVTGSGPEFDDTTGLDEFIVCDAAAKCLEKEGSDAAHLYRRCAIVLDDLAVAADKDQGEPPRIQDTERPDWDLYGWTD